MERYSLQVAEGSGWQGANWLLMLVIPAHEHGPKTWVTIRHFKTEEEALTEAAKLVVDVVFSASVERRTIA